MYIHENSLSQDSTHKLFALGEEVRKLTIYFMTTVEISLDLTYSYETESGHMESNHLQKTSQRFTHTQTIHAITPMISQNWLPKILFPIKIYSPYHCLQRPNPGLPLCKQPVCNPRCWYVYTIPSHHATQQSFHAGPPMTHCRNNANDFCLGFQNTTFPTVPVFIGFTTYHFQWYYSLEVDMFQDTVIMQVNLLFCFPVNVCVCVFVAGLGFGTWEPILNTFFFGGGMRNSKIWWRIIVPLKFKSFSPGIQEFQIPKQKIASLFSVVILQIIW